MTNIFQHPYKKDEKMQFMSFFMELFITGQVVQRSLNSIRSTSRIIPDQRDSRKENVQV